MIDSNIDYIKNHGTTGVLTDYFDDNNINYSFFGDLNLNNDDAFIIGNIKTINCISGKFKNENIQLGLGYLDKVDPLDILVVRGSDKWAYFGELMSTLSKVREIQGAIILGKTRDSRFTRKILPVFSEGYSPIDIKGRGKVKETDVNIEYKSIIINKDGMCAADKDGVIFFDRIENTHFKNIKNILEHERMLKTKIKEGSSVKEILKITDSF
jgi:regulator of RNase E activity RraA